MIEQLKKGDGAVADHSYLRPLGFLLLIASQVVVAILFAQDLYQEVTGPNPQSFNQTLLELGAILVFVVAAVIESIQLANLVTRVSLANEQLKLQQQSLFQVLEILFSKWGLSPAEFDVALFAFKGLEIKAIAELRGTSESTVKAQLSAIYKKAGVQNRADLLVSVIDEIYAIE